jgi:hypothetical protein
MRICLLTNQDLLADPFPADDWPCDPRPFFSDAQWQVEYLKKATAVEQVTRRIQQGFDLFFNLCDGAADQSTPGIASPPPITSWHAATQMSNEPLRGSAFRSSSNTTAVIPASIFPGAPASVRQRAYASRPTRSCVATARR